MENTQNTNSTNTTQQSTNTTEQTKQQVKTAMSGLEARLEPMFKNAPHIPENGRKVIVDIVPWLVLIFGILGVIGLFASGIMALFVTLLTGGWALPFLFGSFVPMLFSGIAIVLTLMAFPGLQAKTKSGWNLVFYSTVVNAIGGIVSVFGGYVYMGSLVGAIIGAIVSFWLLFEIRSYYK